MNTSDTDSIDSLLQLHFGKRKSTDRKALILDRLQQNDFTGEEEGRFDDVTKAAQKDLISRDVLFPVGSGATSDIADRPVLASVAWGRRFLVSLAILAASIAFAVIGLRYWPAALEQLKSVRAASEDAAASTVTDSSSSIARAGQRDALEPLIATEPPPVTNNSITIEPETLSSGGPLVEAVPRRLDWTIAADEDMVERPIPIEWRSIIASLNSYATDLWKASELQTPSEISVRAWAIRTAEVLLGRSPTQEELDEATISDSEFARKAWLERLVASREFSHTWSRHLAAAWIGTNESSRERREFEAWLAEQIQNRQPLGEIQSEFLKNEGGDDPEGADFQPATHWMLSVHRSSHHPAGELGRLLLGQKIGCVRCHDDRTEGLSQRDYWGLQAYLEQFEYYRETRGDYPFDQLRLRELPHLFYTRPDGTQALAIPKLPDARTAANSDRENSVVVLSSWLKNHPSLREHNANVVWETFFGASLVPFFGLGTHEGRTEREAMLKLLGEQMAAHGDSLQQLVIWIAMSAPFRSEEVILGAPRETLASQLARDRLRVQRFHAYRPLIDRAWDQPQQRLRNLAKLYQFSSPAILGQPLPTFGTSVPSDANLVEARLRQLLLEEPIPSEIGMAIDRFIASSMNWESMVEHTYWIAGHHDIGREELELANKVLAASEDRRQALVRVVRTFGL